MPAFWLSWADCSGMIQKAPPGCGCTSEHAKFAGRCWCRQVSVESRDLNLHRGKHSPMERGQRHANQMISNLGANEEGESTRRHPEWRKSSETGASSAMRSQGGVGSGLTLSTCALCRVTFWEPCLFRVLLLLRLRFPLPLTRRN